jgi:hypothetical protein
MSNRLTVILGALLLLAFFSLSGCGLERQHPSSPETIGKVPTSVGNGVSTAAPSPTPLVCSTARSGPALQFRLGAKRESNLQALQTLYVDGRGFQPNEKIMIVVEGHGKQTTSRTVTPSLTVNGNGVFTIEDTLQLAESNIQWQVYAVHSNGTACTKFTTN